MKKFIAGVVIVSFLALLGYRSAAGGNDSQREAQDRLQIEKLMWQYTRALDTENADAYARTAYPEVLKHLNNFVEGTPKVQTYEVANSTFHTIVATAAA